MAAKSLIEEIIATGPVLTDGAWGTEMQARGLREGEIADLWNLTHPERVEEVARGYVEAGSRVLLTNTFRANRIALAPYGAGASVGEVNRAGVEISRRAAGGRAVVFASIGPSGKMLAMGGTSEGELEAAFTEQAQSLAGAGADGLVVETMSDLGEARIAVRAAAATGLPVVACMVFGFGRARDRTMMGVAPEQAGVELARAGADVVGTNCGIGIEECVAICRSLAVATRLPVWVKPNAGLPRLVGGTVVYPSTPEGFAQRLPQLLAAGARFIGGCCGTTPRFIEALSRRLAGQDTVAG